MDISFDISKDELPIFLAEVDEHLQTLDNTLLRMRQEGDDPELIQAVFRSAHTIKGSSGMIGHQRMTEVTHALESVLDRVRKKSLPISDELIDLCMEAVDCLRLLRDEVATSQASEIDIAAIASALKQQIGGESDPAAPARDRHAQPADGAPRAQGYHIRARIDTTSMASAARAFQLMLALQELGDIQSMRPDQQQIEKATSVSDLAAVLLSDASPRKIAEALARIPGIDEISIDDRVVAANSSLVGAASQVEPVPVTAEKAEAASARQQPHDRRGSDAAGRRVSDLTLRMSVERLDHLMNLVGELITDRNRLQQLRGQFQREISRTLQVEQLFETITHLGRLTDQLQEEVMSMRMLPLGSLFSRFPRMVHDMSKKVGKPVNVVVRGEETEMDRLMIDKIYDPLIHIVRNSVDHGIESAPARGAAGKPPTGTITLTARHEQGRIVLTVADDGAGIDCERLRRTAVQKGLIAAEEAAGLSAEQALDLIFLPGLSTAERVTEFSGRGVGLDIVKTNIQRVNGSVRVETRPGLGTLVEITLPLTLAIVPSLLVRVGEATFAIPMVTVSETVRLQDSEVRSVCQRPVMILRGMILPLVRLADALGLSRGDGEGSFVVVIQSGRERVGLIVDTLIGEEEIVVKPLGGFVGDIAGISSATLLGNGSVALIVDVFHLFRLIKEAERTDR